MKNELKFSSAQDYLNYDFDDNFCFFYKELEAYLKSIQKIDPEEGPLVDFEKKFSKIIYDLFMTYDVLVIDQEEEKLYGEIKGVRFFIRDGIHEE